MKDAENRTLLLQAALDGELDAEGILAFERARGDDPALAAEYDRLEALDEALRRAAPIEPAPERLRARIAALGEPSRQEFHSIRRFFAAPPRALAASLLLGVLLGYGGALLQPQGPDIERALVSAFVRAQIGGQSVDVVTSDQHVVKPWLENHAPLAVAAPDLSGSGFPLAGGRVETLDSRVVPTLVYRRRAHRIEVTELPVAGRQGAAVAFGGRDGFQTASWSDADRNYVAVTDLSGAELADFVGLFRAAINAERETGGK